MQEEMFGATPRHLADGDRPDRDPALDQYFTPRWAADLLVMDALRGMGDVSVLEPAAGDGAILGAIPDTCFAMGIEIDPVMAEAARRITGREVLTGDLRTIDLGGRSFEVVVSNPPFDATIIDALVSRAYDMLPEEGVIGLVLPAHIPASSARIERWGARFSIETRILPRNLFPRLTLPLVWTRLVRTRKRTLVGLFLFDEQSDVSAMPDRARRRLQAGGTWRQVIAEALSSLGGEAELRQIYAAVEPRRRSPNPHWRDKTRQVLAGYDDTFTRIDTTRWRLAA